MILRVLVSCVVVLVAAGTAVLLVDAFVCSCNGLMLACAAQTFIGALYVSSESSPSPPTEQPSSLGPPSLQTPPPLNSKRVVLAQFVN